MPFSDFLFQPLEPRHKLLESTSYLGAAAVAGQLGDRPEATARGLGRGWPLSAALWPTGASLGQSTNAGWRREGGLLGVCPRGPGLVPRGPS